MIFDYKQRIFPNKKLPYQGQKPCRKNSWILNTLPVRGDPFYHALTNKTPMTETDEAQKGRTPKECAQI